MGRQTTNTVWLGMAVVVGLAGVRAVADVVVLQSPSGSTVRVTGTVLDYTGQTVRVRTPTGLERSYPSDQVVGVEADRLPDHRQADTLLAAGKVQQASDLYRQAIAQEKRRWVRRRLLVQLIWCDQALGRIESAATRFLALLASDPETPDFGAIPLAWQPSEQVPRRQAEAWLARTDTPAAMLLAASHLLSSDRRPVALQTLRRLAQDTDRRVALLAEAQTWRTELFRATPQQAEAWARRVEAMPPQLRAGPYWLVGQAWAQAGRHDDAALALMRVPVLYPESRRLAAMALLAAAESLAADGQTKAARRLFREVIDHAGDLASSRQARQYLQQATSSDSSPPQRDLP